MVGLYHDICIDKGALLHLPHNKVPDFMRKRETASNEMENMCDKLNTDVNKGIKDVIFNHERPSSCFYH